MTNAQLNALQEVLFDLIDLKESGAVGAALLPVDGDAGEFSEWEAGTTVETFINEQIEKLEAIASINV